MRGRILIGLLAAMLVLAGCTSTAPTAAPTTAPATEPAAASTTEPAAAPTTASTTAVTVQDPWVRAAMMSMPAEQPTMAATSESSSMQPTTEATAEGGSMGGMEGDMSSTVNSAAYLILVNSGSEADALIKAASDVAETVELHTVIMENNVMQMRPVESIEVPANGQAELKPGSFHIMLIGLKQDLKPGDEVKLTLTLRNAGEIEVTATVREP